MKYYQVYKFNSKTDDYVGTTICADNESLAIKMAVWATFEYDIVELVQYTKKYRTVIKIYIDETPETSDKGIWEYTWKKEKELRI